MTEGYIFVRVITFASDRELHVCPGNDFAGDSGYMLVRVITCAGDRGLHVCPGNDLCG